MTAFETSMLELARVNDGSTLELDSLFAFDDDPESLPTFLFWAKKRGVTVSFTNEGEVFTPDDNSVGTVNVTAWMVYLRMNRKYIGAYVKWSARRRAEASGTA